MDELRLRNKKELKSMFFNLKRKGITDSMMSMLIDTLWRNKFSMRTSGFYKPGAVGSELLWDEGSRTFTIQPKVYAEAPAGSVPSFSFYSFTFEATRHRRISADSIVIPNEEGLYCVYYSADTVSHKQVLFVVKNPTKAEMQRLIEEEVMVASLYWDAENGKTLYFGDDRYGSEWNPKMQWYLHNVLHASVDTGLQVTGMSFNEDGSNDSHARFSVLQGSFWHDDIPLELGADVGGANGLPILHFSGADNLPRLTSNAGFQVLKGASRLCYNAGGASVVEAASGQYLASHVFVVNDMLAGQQVVAVMGLNAYDKLATLFAEAKNEVSTLRTYMPHQGQCYLGSVLFHTADEYTNTVKARVVGFTGDEAHSPVTIAEDSKQYLGITEDQELSLLLENLPVDAPIVGVQANHGFIVGQPIRNDATTYYLAQADSAEHANVIGFVSKVIDANTFEYIGGGWLPGFGAAGKEYFLSPDTAGAIIELDDPEVWAVGEVRLSLGWGTPHGMKVEIAVGELIEEIPIIQGFQGAQGIAGADGTSVNIKGSVTDSDSLPGSGNENGDGYITQNDGHLWIWTNGWVDAGLIRGPQGFQGAASTVAGPQGNVGADSTVAGPQGNQGFSGNDSTVAGPQGHQGFSGEDSIVPGPQGQQGAIGADSTVPGAQGNQGVVGAASIVAGPQGFQGRPGDSSTVPGPQGYQGNSGAVSTTPGPQGVPGANSTVAGPRGYQGYQGKAGAASTVAGPQGDPGADSTVEGPQGDPGADSTVAGPQGVPGSDASCEWNDLGWQYLQPKGQAQGVLLNAMCSIKGYSGLALNCYWTTLADGDSWYPRDSGYSSILSQEVSEGCVKLTMNSSSPMGSKVQSHLNYIRFYNTTGNVTTAGTVEASNFILNSERKLKKDIRSVGNLNISNIPIHQFIFKGDKDERVRYGVIVDEVEKIAPNLVYEDENGKKTIAYIDLLVAKMAILEEEVYNLKHQR